MRYKLLIVANQKILHNGELVGSVRHTRLPSVRRIRPSQRHLSSLVTFLDLALAVCIVICCNIIVSFSYPQLIKYRSVEIFTPLDGMT